MKTHRKNPSRNVNVKLNEKRTVQDSYKIRIKCVIVY